MNPACSAYLRARHVPASTGPWGFGHCKHKAVTSPIGIINAGAALPGQLIDIDVAATTLYARDKGDGDVVIGDSGSYGLPL